MIDLLAFPDTVDGWSDWLTDRSEAAFAEADRLRALLAGDSPLTAREAVVAFDDLRDAIEGVSALTNFLANVHPDAEVRERCEQIEQRAQAYATEIGQDRALFARASALDAGELQGETARLHAHLLRDFRRAGIDADDQTRERLRELSARIQQVGQEFDRIVRDDVRSIRVRPDQLGGLPADWVEAHAPEADGLVTITTDYPDLIPVLTFADDREVRVALATASGQRGWPENDSVLAELIALRNEQAQLLGFAGWPDFDVDVKMIESGAAIGEFVAGNHAAVRERAAAETAMLLERVRVDHPEVEALTGADRGWAMTKLRAEQLGVDNQQVREYFSFEAVLDGVLATTSQLFGIVWRPVDVPTWHADVRSFEADLDGVTIGRVHLDLHPRDGKFKHAAQFSLVSGRRAADESDPRRRLAEGALVCNFPRGLMDHSQVTTFFHEFGHLIHDIVGGQVELAAHSGVATEWDFVEAPSQLLEEWAWSPAVLATFARNAAGDVIPDELVAKMRAARDFCKASQAARQACYGMISYQLYAEPAADLDAQVHEIEREYDATAPLADTHQHTSFGHLNGYSSGYYTYMWSLMIAKDLLTAFDADDLMEPAVARRYRDLILARGGAADAADLVADFLGRAYAPDAFREWLAS